LLKNSWQVYKARFKVFLGVLLPAFIVLGATIVLAFIPEPGSAILTLVNRLAGVVVSLWVGVSLLYVMKEREREIRVKEALEKGWKKIFSYWWVVILTAVITWGGFALFIIPGIILSVWFSLAIYVLIVEDLKGMNALLRSKQLVSGYWWKVFGRILALVGVQLVAAIPVLLFLVGIGVAAFLLSDVPADQIERQISPFTALTIGVFQWIVTAFSVVFLFLLYEDLKSAKGNQKFEVPSGGTKLKYIAVGIYGILVFVALIALVVIMLILGALAPTNSFDNPSNKDTVSGQERVT